jgi:MFS family permease
VNRGVAAAVLGNRSLARIELAFAAFNIADWVRWLAIVVFAFDHGGAAEAGVVTLLLSVPSALVAPFAATIGDRFSRPTMLRIGYTAQALLLALAAAAALATNSAALVYLIATLAAIASSLIRPANHSLVPEVTRTPIELTAANVLSSWVEGIGGMSGPLLSGVLVELSSPGVVIGLAAALMTASAALVLRLDTAAVPGARSERAVLGGFIALRRRMAPRTVVIAFTAAALLVGAINVLYVTLALDVLGTGASGAGTLGSALGAGYLVGAALSTTLVGRRRLSGAAVLGLLLAGLPLLVIAAAPSMAVAVSAMLVLGAGHAIYDVASMTLLQRVSPERVLSRIFGIVEAGYLAAYGIGSAVIAWLIVELHLLPALAVAGLWLPLVVVVAWRRLRSVDSRAAVVAAEHIELLQSQKMFASLQPVVLERLARGLWPVHFESGAIILHQGDVGDAFYIVKTGVVRYEIDGRPVGEAGPGASFGEIALLRDVPRTATVIAVTPVLAFALARRPFLDALGGSGRVAAEQVAQEHLA